MADLKRGGFEPLDVAQAFQMQHRLVDTLRRHLDGREQLEAGDYGVTPGLNRPRRTAAVEAILAEFFGAEAAALVRGAGTGAIRLGMAAMVKPGSTILMHRPPVYPTTNTSLENMGLRIRHADLNDLPALSRAINGEISGVLIQHTYQSDDDCYELRSVVQAIREAAPHLPILVDDNYAAFKIAEIGVQKGADASAFSLFKLLGPEGVGCVVGHAEIIERIRAMNYSGGSQVQGPEAMDALQSLVFAPVMHAGSAAMIGELLDQANVPGVTLRLSLIQGLHIVAEFTQPVAEQIVEAASRHGALAWPVGAESRYELSPLFYRMSGTFHTMYPERARSMIRIAPMRAGAETVLSILREAMADVGLRID